ncbi:MAG TPA: dihydroneopterin aldolase [Actinomycetota bacterium]|nr:dihydroneopterin aldolase [Actinomycetota bacterium]
MSDAIVVRGLRVATRIGVTERERTQPQTVVVDLEITADLTRAAASDDLADTVDYSAVVDRVETFVAAAESNLLEHLAARVASVVSRMDGVERVTVEITKDPPPVEQEVDRVSVKIVGRES